MVQEENMNLDIRKILIINPGGIGDLIMLTPCLQILRDNFPEAQIDVFTGFSTPVSGQIIREGGLVGRVIDFDWNKNNFFRKIKFIYKLRKEKYNLSIITTGVNPFKGGFFSYLIGAKIRVGEVRKKQKNVFYTHTSLLEKGKHVIEANVNLLRVIGLKAGPFIPLPFIEIPFSEKNFAQNFFKNNNLLNKIVIGLHPGCGEKQKFRRWPQEYFVELSRKILYNFQYAVILIFGGPGEEKICESIKNELKNDRIVVVTGYSLRQIAALIERCNLFISSDSGLNHIATALNIETISIWGPADFDRTGPRGLNVHILREKCRRPYNIDTLKGYDIERPHTCLKKITSERIFAEVKKVIDKTAG